MRSSDITSTATLQRCSTQREPKMKIKVVVLGGGIIGMTTAVRALETLDDVDVTVVSEQFTPHTTGDVAAGLLKPYCLKGVPEEKLAEWCRDSFAFYGELLQGENSGKIGIAKLSAYYVEECPIPEPVYKDVYFHYRDLTEKELGSFPSRFKYGVCLDTMVVECKKFLPYLTDRFKNKGGRVVQERVDNIQNLGTRYDVIINCTGVGASSLCSDPEIQPVRGQTIRVKAPWIKNAVIGGPEYHVLPNIDDVMLGGTTDAGNFSFVPDPEVRKRIWEGCLELVPSLKHAEIIGDFVGLRPGRNGVRIQRENCTLETTDRMVPVIHNYGHGGSGITLSWGCAGDAVRILQDVALELRLSRMATATA